MPVAVRGFRRFLFQQESRIAVDEQFDLQYQLYRGDSRFDGAPLKVRFLNAEGGKQGSLLSQTVGVPGTGIIAVLGGALTGIGI